MIKQLIVAAGGVGARMSPNANCFGSKSLIEYRGKPLIEHLLTSARDSGFQEVLISVNPKNKERINEIADSVGVPFQIKMTAKTYRGVPGLFVRDIGDRVIIACGHHFIPPSHFAKLQGAAEKSDAVFSAYQDPPNTYGKEKRILVDRFGEDVEFSAVDLATDEVPSSHTYVRTPYVVTREMILRVREEGFKKAVGYYAYYHWLNGGKVGAVDSEMPPEFDFDHELERTKEYIDKLSL